MAAVRCSPLVALHTDCPWTRAGSRSGTDADRAIRGAALQVLAALRLERGIVKLGNFALRKIQDMGSETANEYSIWRLTVSEISLLDNATRGASWFGTHARFHRRRSVRRLPAVVAASADCILGDRIVLPYRERFPEAAVYYRDALTAVRLARPRTPMSGCLLHSLQTIGTTESNGLRTFRTSRTTHSPSNCRFEFRRPGPQSRSNSTAKPPVHKFLATGPTSGSQSAVLEPAAISLSHLQVARDAEGFEYPAPPRIG